MKISLVGLENNYVFLETAAVKVCHTKEQTEDFMKNLLEDSDEEAPKVDMYEDEPEPILQDFQPVLKHVFITLLFDVAFFPPL